MTIAIIDYGSGNLRSAAKAFERVLSDLGRSDTVAVTADPDVVAKADRIVLPGLIARTATARLLQEGQFLSPIEGVTLYIRDITTEGELRDLLISDTRNAEESVTYTASSAYLVETAQADGRAVVAGGIETEGQLRVLERAGVDYLQGYFLHLPVIPPLPIPIGH